MWSTLRRVALPETLRTARESPALAQNPNVRDLTLPEDEGDEEDGTAEKSLLPILQVQNTTAVVPAGSFTDARARSWHIANARFNARHATSTEDAEARSPFPSSAKDDGS